MISGIHHDSSPHSLPSRGIASCSIREAVTPRLPVTGALVGLVAGLGLWLIVVRLPWLRRPTLDQRLAPYVRDARVRRFIYSGSSSVYGNQPSLPLRE